MSDWITLSSFLQKLPALRELTWGCVEQIPSCVLKSIHEKGQPLVRLHMQSFMLRCLRQRPEDSMKLDPVEVELAGSLCLYSLTMLYNNLDEEGFVNYNEQAVLDMVRGGARNLRHIRLFWEKSDNSPWLLQAWRKPRQQWRREILFPGLPQDIHGSLECLEIVAKDLARSLKCWGETTDFSKLRSLIVHSPVDIEAFSWLTTSCRFGSLDDLALNLDFGEQDELDDYSSEGIDALIRHLRPLKSLKLVGALKSQTVSLALERHGLSSVFSSRLQNHSRKIT